jgi:DNA-binding SARP family transcriptional activator
VLGAFELVRDGEPVTFTGKAQQRPLDLLKLLVALGGTNIDGQQLMAALWPDADGAALRPRSTRRCFVCASSSTSRTRLCWQQENSRSRARWCGPTFGRSKRRSTLRIPAAKSMAPRLSAERAAQGLLAAYRGPLLGVDENTWIAKPRDALRARFVRTLMRLGEQLEAGKDWERAIDVYRRGLEADNLAESFYRGLMRAFAATGDQAEALNAFRRCRELLSIVLGVKPSPETDHLYREIAAGRGPVSRP